MAGTLSYVWSPAVVPLLGDYDAYPAYGLCCELSRAVAVKGHSSVRRPLIKREGRRVNPAEITQGKYRLILEFWESK